MRRAEQLGIARSREALADAALGSGRARRHSAAQRRRANACSPQSSRARLSSSSTNRDLAAPELDAPVRLGLLRSTSALTGEGIPALRERILTLATGGAAAEPGISPASVITRPSPPRWRAHDAAQANTNAIPHEMILLDLYRALWALDSLTGQTTLTTSSTSSSPRSASENECGLELQLSPPSAATRGLNAQAIAGA